MRCTWWVEAGEQCYALPARGWTVAGAGTRSAVKLSANCGVGFREAGERVKSPFCATTLFAAGFTFKWATNAAVLLRRAARLGLENTAVLFQLTFFSPQCVKGCLWHFTLISLKRRVKPYSFVWRQVNTWTWRSFSFQAVLKFLIPRDLFIRGVMV